MTEPLQRCQCRTPEGDGTVKHSGKLVTFESRRPDTRELMIVTVCWHHRKWYSGWKKAVKR